MILAITIISIIIKLIVLPGLLVYIYNYYYTQKMYKEWLHSVNGSYMSLNEWKCFRDEIDLEPVRKASIIIFVTFFIITLLTEMNL